MITIKKDLTNVKVAEKRKQIINIIRKWKTEIRAKPEEFRKEFLSEKHNKYFLGLKERIGDFKEIEKMSVLNFIAKVVISKDSKYKIIRELQKDYQKLNEDFYKIK